MSPVMLVLSTFRQSDEAINLAIEKAKECQSLMVVYLNIGCKITAFCLGPSV